MKLAVFAFTRRGCTLAVRIRDILHQQTEDCRMFTMEKFGFSEFESYTPPLQPFVEPVFAWADQIVFVGSTGMAVRAIAPWVRDKKQDPGVLVVDEGGTFVISLLSGHIGGANRLAEKLAQALEAQPVVTTATDVNGKFAVDEWAARNGCAIGSMKLAKEVAAEILERDVPICADAPIVTALPAGVIPGESGSLGIYIGWRDKRPFESTLQLIPKVLQLGIGCRRDTSKENIRRAVNTVLEANGIPRAALCSAASIDLKAQEPGLLEFCREWALPVTFYTAEELRQVPGEFPKSEFVKNITGVDNVCQRAALLGAETVIVKKTAMDGVTVSIAEKSWEVAF